MSWSFCSTFKSLFSSTLPLALDAESSRARIEPLKGLLNKRFAFAEPSQRMTPPLQHLFQFSSYLSVDWSSGAIRR